MKQIRAAVRKDHGPVNDCDGHRTIQSSRDAHLPRPSLAVEEMSLKNDCWWKTCALESFTCIDATTLDQTRTTPQSRRAHFQHWVAYHRNASYHTSTVEQLTCPLLWCRKSFHHPAALNEHLESCSFLDEGAYWCTECQRPERFSWGSTMEAMTDVPSPKNAKKRLVKNALNAFRKLGTKARSSNHQEDYSTMFRDRDEIALSKEYRMAVATASQPIVQQNHPSREVPSYHLGECPIPNVQEGREEDTHDMNLQRSHRRLASKEIVELPGFCPQFELENTSTTSELPSDAISCPSFIWDEADELPTASSVSSDSTIIPEESTPTLSNVETEASWYSLSTQLSLWASDFSQAIPPTIELVCPDTPVDGPSCPSDSGDSFQGTYSMLDDLMNVDLNQPAISSGPDPYADLVRDIPMSPLLDSDEAMDWRPTPATDAVEIIPQPFDAHLLSVDVTVPNPDNLAPREQTAQASDPKLKIITDNLRPIKRQRLEDVPTILWSAGPFGPTNDQEADNVQKHTRIGHYLSVNKDENATSLTSTLDHLDSITQLKLVEDLRDIFEVQFNESIAKMSQASISSSISGCMRPNLSPINMLNTGLQALRSVFLGTLPTTLSEILAICQLAYAATFALDQQEMLDQSEELFVDVCHWAQAISSVDDRAKFLDLAWQLWSPGSHCQLLPPTASQLDRNQPFVHHHDNGNGSITELGALAHSQYYNHYVPHQIGYSDKELTLLPTLRKGIVLRTCLRHLDILRYAGIRAVESANTFSPAGYSPSPFVQFIKQKITEPLIQYRGLEGFIKEITQTEKLLDRGVLVNLRDCHVKTIYGARCASKSAELYETFQDVASSLFDGAFALADHDFASRDRSYSQDVDKVLSLLEDLDRDKLSLVASIVSRPSSVISYDTASSMDQTPIDTMSSSSSSCFDIASDYVNSSSASSISHTRSCASTTRSHKGSFSTWNLPRQPTPIATRELHGQTLDETQPYDHNLDPQVRKISELHGSEPSSPSSSATPNALSCDLCGATFKGQSAWLKSNLRRHMRTIHPHKRQKLVCSHKDCGKTFSRSDNLLNHQRKAHGMKTDAR